AGLAQTQLNQKSLTYFGNSPLDGRGYSTQASATQRFSASTYSGGVGCASTTRRRAETRNAPASSAGLAQTQRN
ncbi:MAG: hypothetical protein IJ387_04650, partial [Thermoguttaceae bacterium]|nr:hypothetical protein [Thermoguttaceae bacterium]